MAATQAQQQMQMKVLPSEAIEAAHQARGWSPYVINGGTTLAVAGTDFCIVAGDTRMSSGYSINSRDVSKIYPLTSKCVIATSGMQAEAATLRKVLRHKIVMYKHANRKDMSATACAQMLSNTLYYKRFFPFYTFNVVGGVDSAGKGAVWGYDAVGSFERSQYCVTGSGATLITSLLDNQVAFKTQPGNKRDLTLDETVDLVKDAFTCCGERDIYTGDNVNIAIITSEGTRFETFELKRD